MFKLKYTESMLSIAKAGGAVFNVWNGALINEEVLKHIEVLKGGILVCPFETVAEIDLSQAILGSTETVKQLVRLSLEIDGIIFCGVKTKIMDIWHISVAVCAKGKLYDLADRVSNPFNDSYSKANMLKSFTINGKTVGLFVDADCLMIDNWENMSGTADIILCINRGNSTIFRQRARQRAKEIKMPYLYVDEAGLEWIS